MQSAHVIQTQGVLTTLSTISLTRPVSMAVGEVMHYTACIKVCATLRMKSNYQVHSSVSQWLRMGTLLACDIATDALTSHFRHQRCDLQVLVLPAMDHISYRKARVDTTCYNALETFTSTQKVPRDTLGSA